MENAAYDRLSSKRTVKTPCFGHRALGTRQAQDLYVTRFDTFYTCTLKKSLDTPFSGDDLLGFF